MREKLDFRGILDPEVHTGSRPVPAFFNKPDPFKTPGSGSETLARTDNRKTTFEAEVEYRKTPSGKDKLKSIQILL